MTKPHKTPKPTPQPLTPWYLETLARNLVNQGLATPNILEPTPKPRKRNTQDERQPEWPANV